MKGTRMHAAMATYGLLAGLAIALVIAAATDIASRRIANWLTAAVALGAPLFWWASGMDLWPGVAGQLALAGVTFAVGAGLFAMRAMGGGDVKLLAALALWMAPLHFVQLIVLMALLGGILTICMVVARAIKGGGSAPIAVPYGVAIALAGLWVLAPALLPAGAPAPLVG